MVLMDMDEEGSDAEQCKAVDVCEVTEYVIQQPNAKQNRVYETCQPEITVMEDNECAYHEYSESAATECTLCPIDHMASDGHLGCQSM